MRWADRMSASPRTQAIVNMALAVVITGLCAAYLFLSLQTHDALCSLRAEVDARANSTEQFLREHPHLDRFQFGPVGITRGFLVAQLASERVTTKALDGLHC
jgi:hypothetical protein